MGTIDDPRNRGLHPSDRIGGYRIEGTTLLPDMEAICYQLRHIKTGACHVHISRADRENTFAVALKTIPTDSSGVAHILEHTVLCGSNKYPVRDPFFSMLKRSLSTFMNAFTAPDWTMYPFSTQNRKDFENLMDVYLDAVFFPILDALSFKQEGHRLDWADEHDNDELTYKGVVYNEMRGAMSSPDQIMARKIMAGLYPDTTYRHNSGGDPAVIPALTHDQLVAFHRTHYHPGNAYFYTYGDQPLRDHLSFIEDKVLARFSAIDPNTTVDSQPRWRKAHAAVAHYPLAASEDPERKAQVCLAWLTADVKDRYEVLLLTLLEQILLGNAGAPLRKALIDSKLGTALCDGCGYHDEHRDTMWVVGLKGIRTEDADAVAQLIMQSLQRLHAEGLDRQSIDAAIHQVEFHRKEITNTPYPYGLRLLLTIAGSWIHGADPSDALHLDADFKRLRKELAEGKVFEDCIARHLLDNPHRLQFRLEPDPKMELRESERVRAELAELRKSLSAEQQDEIRADARVLDARQQETEDISVLPTLQLADIPPDVTGYAPQAPVSGGVLDLYEQPTSGIVYASAVLGIQALQADQVPLLPFFCYAMTRMGTADSGYGDLARRIDAHTGGLGAGANARSRFDNHGGARPFVSMNSKCLNRNVNAMVDLMAELTCRYRFSDIDRLMSLLREYRAGLEAAVVQNGHRLALSLASRNFSPISQLSERWHGIHQLSFIKALTGDVTPASAAPIAEQLTAMADTLFSGNNLKMALVGEADALTRAVKAFDNTGLVGMAAENLPEDQFGTPPLDLDAFVPHEGWSTSTAVSFVASTFPTVRMGHPDAPVLAVVAKLLRSCYLHREIREKGGAYGGFALYNPEDGLFGFGSYRDPHIVATIDVYQKAAQFLLSGAVTDTDVNEAVLQVCSDIDRPDPPGPGARKAFFRKILGLSDELRLDFKRQLLKMDQDRIGTVAASYFQAPSARSVVVISGSQRLAEANEQLGRDKLQLHQI